MIRISSKTHGLLDYIVGGAVAALPHVVPCSDTTKRVLHAAGWGAAAYSIFTDYERGLVKVLPMKAHLTLDALSGAGLIASAMLLDDAAEPRAPRRHRRVRARRNRHELH